MATEGRIWLPIRSTPFRSEQVACYWQQAWKEDLILETTRVDSKQCRKVMIDIARKEEHITPSRTYLSESDKSPSTRGINKKRDKCEQPM